MNLEDDLRKALRREPAPDGFAARVLEKAGVAAVPAHPAQRWWAGLFPRRRTFFPAVCVTAAAIAGAIGLASYQEHRRALEARRDLLAALNITKSSLQKAQERMRRISSRPVI